MNDKYRRALQIAVTILGFSTLVADGGLREDEIDCEEAVAYLQQCCPGFARTETLQCVYGDSCGVIEPALSIDQSQCILGLSCPQIVANGICDRAAHLSSPSSAPPIDFGTGGGSGAGGGSSSSLTPATVCP
jgi:hypothetical protein